MPDADPVRTAFMEVTFGPNTELVGIVRRFVSDLYGQSLLDGDTVSRLTLATHELLDNAVRHTTNAETGIRVSVDSRAERVERVQVRTWNHADPDHIGTACRLIDEAANAPDPFVLYQRLMRETAKRTDGSGLGLVRIRVESEFDLAYRVEGNVLHVTATWNAPTA